MKEHSFAISVSLLFHIIVVALFLHVPFDQYIRPKLMVLDFSLENGRVADGAKNRNRKSGSENRETDIENRKSKIENRTVENKGTIINREQNIQGKFAVEPSLVKQNNVDVIVSDPAGQVTVRGETGPMGAKTDSVLEKNISVGEGSRNPSAVSGGMKVIDYGKGDSDAKDFPFIADTIQKRFKDKYPDRARRMGWEGEVRVSFIISEDGTIHDLEIVKSSGRNVFDNHAREILTKTTFNRRLPFQLRVENRAVIYKLQ
jgi:TonB family protein